MFTLTITGGLALRARTCQKLRCKGRGRSPIRPCRCARLAFGPRARRGTVDAVKISRRRPMGFGSKRAVGLRPHRGARPPDLKTFCAVSGPLQQLLPGGYFSASHRAASGRRAGDLGACPDCIGFNPRNRRRGFASENRWATPARTELPSSLSDETLLLPKALRVSTLRHRHDADRRPARRGRTMRDVRKKA